MTISRLDKLQTEILFEAFKLFSRGRICDSVYSINVNPPVTESIIYPATRISVGISG